MKLIHVIGGGTFNHVRSHLALAAPAFGSTAKKLAQLLQDRVGGVRLHLTKMADSNSAIVTNNDVETLVDKLVAAPDTKGIIFNVALCDYVGQIGDIDSGKYATRLQSRKESPSIQLEPSAKIVGRIRAKRKDIFVVGFKTTVGAYSQEQYEAGLKLLKENSLNLVFANDLTTRNNIIIVPEEAWYSTRIGRDGMLEELADMFVARHNLTYTRSDVRDGPSVDWNGPLVPDNLRTVVNHCIERGAYKPFLGKTAGHFAFNLGNGAFVTSKRKTNYNQLNEVGLVRVEAYSPNYVIAYGAKPSVGGQSQRIVFNEHPGFDNIVHFHCPRKPGSKVNVMPQWMYECGSHQCGKNTSDGLQEVPGHTFKAVYLDNHGPNIVFGKYTDPEPIIEYIEQNFDLEQKTGGTFKESNQTRGLPLMMS